MTAKPLSGVRVLDLTRILAGPFCTAILANLGAEVIKIEEPVKGDDSREFTPHINGESAYFMSYNNQKKSITLDLKKKQGREIFLEMVKFSDVVVENFRNGVMKKLDIDYTSLSKIKPDLIYASLSGFGSIGLYKNRPAYDVVVQGISGAMSLTGSPDGEPTRIGLSIADLTGGVYTAIGIISALYAREKGMGGQKIDLAILDCLVAIMGNHVAQYTTTGKVPLRVGNRHRSIAPFSSYRTLDSIITVAAGNDRMWAKLCHCLGIDELIDDPRFATNALRVENVKELEEILQKIFSTKTSASWLELLNANGVPCGPINTVAEVVHDPHILAQEMIVEVDHPVIGLFKTVGFPIKFSRTPCRVEKPAPVLGQHTEEILTQMLGLTPGEIEILKKERVILGRHYQVVGSARL